MRKRSLVSRSTLGWATRIVGICGAAAGGLCKRGPTYKDALGMNTVHGWMDGPGFINRAIFH